MIKVTPDGAEFCLYFLQDFNPQNVVEDHKIHFIRFRKTTKTFSNLEMKPAIEKTVSDTMKRNKIASIYS